MQRTIFGKHDENTIAQFDRCLNTGDLTGGSGSVVGGVLCADGHYGYSQPVGGVIAYDGLISPSGVGYDIGCGNKAVRTNLHISDLKEGQLSKIMDDIARTISFGVGRTNSEKVDHDLFDDDRWAVYKSIGTQEHDSLKALARNQLGTVGSGNHYVDLLTDEDGFIWVANHFGSRGFGHKTASGFLNLAAGRKFSDKAPGESMDQPPTLFNMHSHIGDLYFQAMNLAGRYAYAGRDYVINQVLKILQADSTYEVHNHHNFAWQEEHSGKTLTVVRKGATPLAVGQQGFIGGSMGDIAVIVEGVDSDLSRQSFYSTVHGAGRVMSRTQAAGKMNWKTRQRSGGAISREQMDEAVKAYGVELRGAGTDESPFVYRKLADVLSAHEGTLKVLHTLRPIGVCMAGADEFDPYKD